MQLADLEATIRLCATYGVTHFETPTLKLVLQPGNPDQLQREPIYPVSADAAATFSPVPEMTDDVAEVDEDPRAFMARMRAELQAKQGKQAE